jgi:hypothetical protein
MSQAPSDQDLGQFGTSPLGIRNSSNQTTFAFRQSTLQEEQEKNMKNIRFGIIGILGLATAALTIVNSQSLEFKSFKLTYPKERITGILCSNPKSCVISTDVSEGGKVYASNGQSMGATLIDGAYSAGVGEKVKTLGALNFLGFSKFGDRVMVRATVSQAFITSKGDFTNASNWSVTTIGKTTGGNQTGIGMKDDRWVSGSRAVFSESLDEPSPGAIWDVIWSPDTHPSNFFQLWRESKQTLCNSEPGFTTVPWSLQSMYVAADLSILAYTTNPNARNPEKAAVCLSSDGGKRFYRAELPGIKEQDHPIGVTCISSNTCFTFSNKKAVFYGETDYIYYTNDAQKNVASTWKAAKLPTLRTDSSFNSIFFAPDGKNGWAVGQVGNNSPLLLSTVDGGETWRDISVSIRGLVPEGRLHSGFALDANNVWLGTNQGMVLTSAK